MNRRRFEQLVEETLGMLPDFFQEKIENVVVVVEDYPDPPTQEEFGGALLLGLYRGVPKTERSVFDPLQYPDIIFIYQRNIERVCRTDDEVRREIRATVVHEIGHYFGLTEEEL